MLDACDLSNLSVSTADDEISVKFLDQSDLATARSIENFVLPDDALTSQFYIGVSTEEDGHVQAFFDPVVKKKMCFPLRDVNFCVNLTFEDSLLEVFTESRDSTEWSILAQVRFRVGSANFEEPMEVVDADVFRFGPYAQPVTIKINDSNIFRLAIEMRYIYKTKLFDLTIVPTYTDVNSLINFDSESKQSIKLVVSGRAFYPNQAIMNLHNLSKFGRGNSSEYYPQMTVELRQELSKEDLRADDMINALLCFLHPPHQPVQQKFIRSILIFAHVHCMPYLLYSMENALIMEPPITARLLLEHFHWGEKWKLVNLIRDSLVRAEGSYREIAIAMTLLPDYGALLSLELRQMISNRIHCGWARDNRCLAERIPTKNLHRVVCFDKSRAVRDEDACLHTFAEIKSSHAFGLRH